MSLIEFAPQKTKEYDPRKQDHGDAAQQHGHLKNSYRNETFDGRGVNRRNEERLKTELNELNVDYVAMTSAELSAEADKLLDDEYASGYETTTGKTDSVLTDAEILLDTLEGTPDEQEVRELLNTYETLSSERKELLDRIGTESFEDTRKSFDSVDVISKKLQLIEEKVSEIVRSQDPFPIEAEFGLRSKHEIRAKMAKLATLDAEYDDDDSGDSDYNSPIRIKNRL